MTTAPEAPASEGWTARLVVGEPAGTPDSWIDIYVPGTSEQEQRTCAALHDEELSLLRQQPVAFRTALACARSTLPGMPRRSAGTWLLESGRVLVEGAAPPLASLGRVPPLEPTPGSTVWWYSRFESRARCEESLAALEAARVQAHAESGTRAGEFLEEELRRAAAKRDASCARLASLPADCRRARDRASCTVTREQAERTCRTDQRMHQVVLERVDRVARERQAGPPLTPGVLKARCRPE